ncbi:MAG: ABC transporter ATP-binding protein/permease [Clostridiales bacterium]|nr:ABC transporter ATP-binding protein/permease [Clostridiales bacterium]
MKDQTLSSRGSVLLRLVHGSKRFFIASVLFAWMTSLLDLINPKIISFTVDAVIGESHVSMPGFLNPLISKVGGEEGLRNNLGMIALAILTIALLAGSCRYAFRVMNFKGQERMLKNTRTLLYRHITSLPLTWHNQNHTGDIIQRCTSDVDVLRSFLSDHITTLIRMVVSILLSIAFMLSISWKLTLMVCCFIPVIILFSYFFHIRIEASFQKVDEMEGHLSAVAQENLTGVRVVRAFGRENYERKRFEESNEEYTGLWKYLMHLLSLFWATGDAISGLQTLLILLIGASYCLAGELTVGNYIAFLSYSAMLSGPVRMLGRVISGMSRSGVSIDRIRYILNAPSEVNTQGEDKPDMTGDIVFEHVAFRYGENDADVLQDISFTAKAGKVTGILGSTGSGKSTLMYLLCRLYDLPDNSGRILVGGKDIASMDRKWVREHVGIVLQEPYLFSKTLGENIAMTKAGADMEQIRESARIAALDETVTHFAKGYETDVGERGVTLSGGQKQRTAIAQTLMRHTPITILDDSLSAVDTETDAKIRLALDNMPEHSTKILISHRITTLMHADTILVLDKGKVVEQGTHAELIAKNGLYKKICDMQSPEGALET